MRTRQALAAVEQNVQTVRVQVHFLRQFDPAAQYRLLTKYALQTSCGTAGLSDDRCRVSKGPASGNGIEYEITLYFRIDAEPPSALALKTNLEAAYASHRAPAALYGVPQCEVWSTRLLAARPHPPAWPLTCPRIHMQTTDSIHPF